jgi:hypothetical protein
MILLFVMGNIHAYSKVKTIMRRGAISSLLTQETCTVLYSGKSGGRSSAGASRPAELASFLLLLVLLDWTLRLINAGRPALHHQRVSEIEKGG